MSAGPNSSRKLQFSIMQPSSHMLVSFHYVWNMNGAYNSEVIKMWWEQEIPFLPSSPMGFRIRFILYGTRNLPFTHWHALLPFHYRAHDVDHVLLRNSWDLGVDVSRADHALILGKMAGKWPEFQEPGGLLFLLESISICFHLSGSWFCWNWHHQNYFTHMLLALFMDTQPMSLAVNVIWLTITWQSEFSYHRIV